MFENNDVLRFAIGVVSFFIFLGSVWLMGLNAFGQKPPSKMVGQTAGGIAAFAAIMGAIAFFNPPLFVLEMIAGSTIFVVGLLAASAFIWKKRGAIHNWFVNNTSLIWKALGAIIGLAILGTIGYLTYRGYANGEPNWLMIVGVLAGLGMIAWTLIWDTRKPEKAYWGVFVTLFSLFQIGMPMFWPLAIKGGLIWIGVHVCISVVIPFGICSLMFIKDK